MNKNERDKKLRQIAVSIVFQVIPITGHVIFNNKWTLWFLIISIIYFLLSLLVFLVGNKR